MVLRGGEWNEAARRDVLRGDGGERWATSGEPSLCVQLGCGS